jgi:hypothetical protein
MCQCNCTTDQIKLANGGTKKFIPGELVNTFYQNKNTDPLSLFFFCWIFIHKNEGQYYDFLFARKDKMCWICWFSWLVGFHGKMNDAILVPLFFISFIMLPMSPHLLLSGADVAEIHNHLVIILIVRGLSTKMDPRSTLNFPTVRMVHWSSDSWAPPLCSNGSGSSPDWTRQGLLFQEPN